MKSEMERLSNELKGMYSLNKEGWEKVEKYEKRCQSLLDSNKELADVGSTILAIMVLEKFERYDIAERLKKAIINSSKLVT